MGLVQSINYQSRAEWLFGKAWNKYTQFGEDGLIDAVFQRIGTTNRQCFEVGAADGLFFSNTLRLREEGWQAVLIEAEERQFQKLLASYGDQSTCIQEVAKDLDSILDGRLDITPDLGVIDIDGQDYWLWHDMELFRPRVMLVEIATQGADNAIPERGGEGQAGLTHIEALGASKGYQLVAETYCNALFVLEHIL